MRTLILVLLVAAFAIGPADLWAASQKPVSSDVEMNALKEMAARIPLGTRVKAQTTAGRGISGTLMSASADAVIIKKKDAAARAGDHDSVCRACATRDRQARRHERRQDHRHRALRRRGRDPHAACDFRDLDD